MPSRPSKKRKRVVRTGTPAPPEKPAAPPEPAVQEEVALQEDVTGEAPGLAEAPETAPAAVLPTTPISRYRGIIIGVGIAFIALVVVLLVSSGDIGGAKPAATAQATPDLSGDAAFAGIDRTDISALMQRGKDLYDQGRYEDAVRVYSEVVRLKPDNEAAQSNLGSSYFRLQQIDNALAAFREAVRLNPNDAEALQNLGAGLAALGNYDDAIQQYLKAVAINPDLAPAHYSLGVLYQEQNNKDKAISELQRYLEIGTDAQLRADAQQRLQTLGAQ
jgi:Flp pilus assembly protein TadD